MFTSKSDPSHARFPNVLNRQFRAERPDRVWVTDVTSVWTFEGWLYLAIVLDLYSRRVVGWSMGEKCGEDLTIGALQMAIDARRPKPGLVHHSDRGIHYTSSNYQKLLITHQMRCSMSRIANCLDNAVAESFFSSLKNEETLHERYRTRGTARGAIFGYIEMTIQRGSTLVLAGSAPFSRSVQCVVDHVSEKAWSAHPAPNPC